MGRSTKVKCIEPGCTAHEDSGSRASENGWRRISKKYANGADWLCPTHRGTTGGRSHNTFVASEAGVEGFTALCDDCSWQQWRDNTTDATMVALKHEQETKGKVA